MKDKAREESGMNLKTLKFFAQSVHIKLASPQAAWLSNFFTGNQ